MYYPQDLGRDQAPRNQYESHQQMMQQQYDSGFVSQPQSQPAEGGGNQLVYDPNTGQWVSPGRGGLY